LLWSRKGSTYRIDRAGLHACVAWIDNKTKKNARGMPWNDNANPGPWGSPPGGGDDDRKDVPARRPQDNGGGSRGPRGTGGPDLNAGFEQLRRRFSGLFGGGGGRGLRPGVLAAIGAAVVALWALSGFYVVQPNEQAVVMTFGAWTRSELPGLRYHLPTPIESVEKVPVLSLNRLDLGGGGTADTDIPQESLMLTRDLDIVDLSWTVTWRIADAGRYVFSLKPPQEDAVKAVAESAMREIVGKTELDSIFGNGRGKAQLETAALMQKTLDGWGAGITIVEVQIKSVNPPNEVLAAFRDVTSAGQDRDSAVNVANAYRNRVVNEAKGTAAQITQSAEAYKEQAVRTALGDAARFNAIDAEYRKSPQATRERLYLETMERVLANSKKVVIPAGKNGTTAPIILPPSLFRSGSDAAPAPAAAAAPAPAPQQAPQQ
jgi:membrane protease subunit HflK